MLSVSQSDWANLIHVSVGLTEYVRVVLIIMNIFIFFFFNFSHSGECRVILHCFFFFFFNFLKISLLTNAVEPILSSNGSFDTFCESP